MRFLLTICSLLLFAALSAASGYGQKVYLPDHYPVGYSYDGYTKQVSGLYYNGSAYANLVEYKVRRLSDCGCYYYWQTYYYWKPAVAPQVAKLNYRDSSWRANFVEMLRDNAEAEAFERSMQAAGLKYGNYGSSYYRSTETNYYGGGHTQYRREAVDLVNPLDLNVVQQQIYKNIEGMQTLQSQSSTERREIVSEVVTAQAIRELSHAYERLLKAQQPSATIRQEERGTHQHQGQERQVLRTVPPDLMAVDKKYNCSGCHAKHETARWTPEIHMTLSGDEYRKVLDRLVTKDKGLRMPRGHEPLTSEEIVSFLVR